MKSRISSNDIDKTPTEAIVLPFFKDERPLKGATGFVDWRMNGKISRMIMDGFISGKKGDNILIAPDSRIKGAKILMMGMGNSSKFSEADLKKLSKKILDQMVSINANNFTIAIPPKKLTNIEVSQSAATIIEEIVKEIGRKKINGDQIFATISIAKEDFKETKQTIDNLRKKMKEKN